MCPQSKGKEELFMKLCFSPPEEKVKINLSSVDDLKALADFAIRRKLGPVLYKALLAKDLLNDFDEESRTRLEQSYYFTALKNKLFQDELKKVHSMLGEHRIKFILLKGIGLIASGVHPSSERALVDLDFLVSREKIGELKGLIRTSLGYQEVVHFDFEPWNELHFLKPVGKELSFHDPLNIWLEFHTTFRSLNNVPGDKIAKRFLDNARVVDFQGRDFWVPSLEDQFLQAALHSIAYHPFDAGYFWVGLLDLYRLWEKKGKELDVERLLKNAIEDRMEEHLALMMFLVQEVSDRQNEVWRTFSLRNGGLSEDIVKFGRRVLEVMLKETTFSLENLIFIFARCGWIAKWNAMLNLLKLNNPWFVEIEGKRIDIATDKPGLILLGKLKRLRFQYLKFFFSLWRFYRKIDYFAPGH